MKKIILFSLVLALTSCGQGWKYEIKDGKTSYFTNSYKKSGDCIMFEVASSCGCEVKESDTQSNNLVTVCGNYSIIEHKDYKPNN